VWVVAVAIFEIGADGQVGGGGKTRGVLEHGFGADRAIRPAEGECKPGAGGGERLEAELLQQARRAGVPRIGNEEGAIALVQRAKGDSPLGLRGGHEEAHCTVGAAAVQFGGDSRRERVLSQWAGRKQKAR